MAEDWDAVARAIDGRLVELGLELRELARRSKVSESTLRELRYNTVERRRPSRTLEGVSASLDWPEDYLERLLAGAAPPEIESGDSVLTRIDSVDRRLDGIEVALGRVLAEVTELRRTVRGEQDVGG